jgi:hypothetical protein
MCWETRFDVHVWEAQYVEHACRKLVAFGQTIYRSLVATVCSHCEMNDVQSTGIHGLTAADDTSLS